ncbi:MAG: hypothetical protein LBI48_00660 [Burkholderiaceae bacterium]|jgi:hypothetical protein|nr:hypothetical protein [Burkholderiaceae bacterium]
MFKQQNDTIAGRAPVPTADDVALVAPRFVQECAASDSASGNVGVIGILPAGCTPALPLIVDSTGLGGAAALSIGLLNAGGTDLSADASDGGGPWAADVAVGAAGAAQIAPTAALLAVQKTGHDRLIAVKFTAAGSAAGTLGLTVAYRSPV